MKIAASAGTWIGRRLDGLRGGTQLPQRRSPMCRRPLPRTVADAAVSPAPPISAADADLATWWRALNDAELNSLVERAVKSNLDLDIALDRLQQARTYEAVVVGHALPEVDASAAAGRGTGSDLTKGRADQCLRSADTRHRACSTSTPSPDFRRGVGTRPVRQIPAGIRSGARATRRPRAPHATMC